MSNVQTFMTIYFIRAIDFLWKYKFKKVMVFDLIEAYSKMRATDLQEDKGNIMCYMLKIARGGSGFGRNGRTICHCSFFNIRGKC